MKNDTVVKVALGQGVGRGVQELSPYLDQKVDAVYGQPASRLANAAIGAGGMYVAVMNGRKLNADVKLMSAVAGSRLLVDAVIDGILDVMNTPTNGAALSAPRVRVVQAKATNSVPNYSNGGLVTVD